MHSFWFALQRNGFILNPPNFNAFFSSLLIKIPYSGFPKPHFFAFRTGFHSPFTQMQTFSASKICLLKSISSRSIDCSPLSTSTLHAIGPHNHQPQYNERKEPVKNRDKKGSRKLLCEILCDSDRIQTCNLLIRSQMLYSVELRSHFPQNSSSISVE